MSSITPLLDTLVHQVAAQKGAVSLNTRGTAPVAPIQATASSTQFSQTGQQFARLLQLVEGLQSELGNTPSSSRFGVVRMPPLFSQQESIQVDALIKHLNVRTQHTGFFYESLLKRWAQDHIPFEAIRHQPQNVVANLRTAMAKQQLEMVGSGLFRFEFNVAPDLHLFGVVQPDVHPLVRQSKGQSPQNPTEDEHDDNWTSELEIRLQHLGRVRARIRFQSQRVYLEVQTTDDWLELVKKAVPGLQNKIIERQGLRVDSIIIRGGL